MTSRAQQWDRRVERGAEALARWLAGHWPVHLALAFSLLLGGVFLAPLLQAAGWEGPARAIYAAGSLVCHQRPERSLRVAGAPAAVCARDIGILLGLAGLSWLWALTPRLRWSRAIPLWGLALAAGPAALDGALQMAGLWESTNALRLATGSLLGSGVMALVLPLLARGFVPPRGP